MSSIEDQIRRLADYNESARFEASPPASWNRAALVWFACSALVLGLIAGLGLVKSNAFEQSERSDVSPPSGQVTTTDVPVPSAEATIPSVEADLRQSSDKLQWTVSVGRLDGVSEGLAVVSPLVGLIGVVGQVDDRSASVVVPGEEGFALPAFVAVSDPGAADQSGVTSVEGDVYSLKNRTVAFEITDPWRAALQSGDIVAAAGGPGSAVKAKIPLGYLDYQLGEGVWVMTPVVTEPTEGAVRVLMKP